MEGVNKSEERNNERWYSKILESKIWFKGK